MGEGSGIWLVALSFGQELRDCLVCRGQVDSVEFSSDLVQRPRQDLAAGRAVCLHVAFVVDSLEIILIVLQVHLAAYYHGIVVFAELLSLDAGVVEAFREQIAAAVWTGKVRNGARSGCGCSVRRHSWFSFWLNG